MKNYVEGLDLSFDPFEPSASKKDFYGGGNRQELCNQIVESAMYGENIIAVYGCLGSGKSTLATEIAKSFADEAVSVLVVATLFMNSDQFIESLADQLDLPSTDFGKEKTIEEISELAHQLDLEAKSLLVQIDNAHELSRDVMHDLLQIKSVSPANTVHIVLFGESQLANMLQSILTTEQGAGLIEFELNDFASDATIDYVRFKLERAGYSKPLPMTGADLGSIHNSSNGVPGVINSLTSDVLERAHQMSDIHSAPTDFDIAAGPANRRSEGEQESESGRSPAFVYMIAASVLVVIFLAAIVFIQPDSQPSSSETSIPVATTASPVPSSSSAVRDIAAPSPTRTVQPSPAPLTVSADNMAASAAVSQSPSSSGPVNRQPARTDADNVSPPKAESVATMAPKPAAATPPKVDTEPKIAATAATAPVKAAAPVPEKIPAIKAPAATLSNYEQKIMRLPSSNYVVQILGASSRDNIQSFIDKEKISPDTGYFETRLNGKPWFVVIVGNYPDRASATSAMNTLPEAAKAYGPWVRGVADIQSAISALQPSN